MKTITARVPIGKTAVNQKIELYTLDEAKEILVNKEWDIGVDIYSTQQTNRRIGWLASFPDGGGIYIEV